MNSAELRFVGLVAVFLLLILLIIFDPFKTVSFGHRSLAGLTLGPMAIGYGIYGIIRGRFPEMVDANRNGHRTEFWFCAASFLILGIALTLFSAVALAVLAWA